jgi:MOSC domain-containing protein YiiM
MSVEQPRTSRVVATFLTPKRGEPAESRPSVTIQADFGVVGDAHAKPASGRQLLLMDAETLAALDLPPGTLKENLTTSGLALHSLPLGTRLRVGEAVVELTKHCPPCADLNDIRPGLQREAAVGRRGVLARAVQDGEVRVGDVVAVL